jgi:single-stranded DNA-binding protein
VVGRLKQDRWTGTDGKQYSKIKVVAEHVEFKPQFKGKPEGGAAADDSNESGLAGDAASLALAAGAEFDTIAAPETSPAF